MLLLLQRLDDDEQAAEAKEEKMARRNTRGIAAGMALSLVLTSAGCGNGGAAPGSEPGSETTVSIAAEETGDVKESESHEAGVSGTFEGSAQGFQGEVKVTLTLENGVLVAASAEGEEETPDNASGNGSSQFR